MGIVLEKYELPESWACFFLYGDESGMDESEIEAADSWFEAESRGGAMICVAVDSDDSGDFRRYHDAAQFYPYAANVATFTFDVEG